MATLVGNTGDHTSELFHIGPMRNLCGASRHFKFIDPLPERNISCGPTPIALGAAERLAHATHPTRCGHKPVRLEWENVRALAESQRSFRPRVSFRDTPPCYTRIWIARRFFGDDNPAQLIFRNITNPETSNCLGNRKEKNDTEVNISIINHQPS